MQTKVNYPRCKKQLIWEASSEFRPFCSERCRLQDLGAWFMEEHVIRDEENTDIEDQDQDLSQNIN